jgi:hypothetical protein
MATQTPGLGTPLLKKRTGASVLNPLGGGAGEARMSYRNYRDPYSAPVPDYMEALITALPGSLPMTLANFLDPTQGRKYAVYGGGTLGKPGPGVLAGMSLAQSDAYRAKWDKATADAAAGYSTNEPGISMSKSTRQRNEAALRSARAQAARKAGAQNVDQGPISPGEQGRRDRAAARSRQAAGHPGGRRGSQSVSSSRSSLA